MGVTSFNSTLVQLKAHCLPIPGQSSLCFNSTLVQLKADNLLYEPSADWCFNSTLVQLKVYCINGYPKLPTSFNSTLVQLKAVKNANKYTSKSMIYHPFILIFYKHLQSTFNS